MFWRILASQAWHKWHITLLLWVAMTALVSLYVYLGNSARFSNRSMQLVMKNMGHNLLILPKQADPFDVYLCTDKQRLFPADVTARMAGHRRLASKYYTSVLQQRVAIGGRGVILTGIEPVFRGDETAEKAHLTTPVPAGHVRLGAAAAGGLKVAEGDAVAVLSRTYGVSEVLDPLGTLDDYRVYLPLGECQELLGKPGQINAVWSFLCLHGASLEGVSRRQEAQFAKLFPDYRIIAQTRI